MLQDIDNGKVNLVITKDLSRLGRNYIETGHYKRIKGDIRFKNKGWTYVTVRKILGDVVYPGHIVSNKYEVIIQTSL